MNRTVLYRHYDRNAVLLYVGITNHALNRLSNHRTGSSWFENVACSTYEWFNTRAGALAAERRAIENEKPLFNEQYGRFHKKRDDGLITSTEAAEMLGILPGQLRIDVQLDRCVVPYRREKLTTYQDLLLFDPIDIENYLNNTPTS